MFDVFKVYATDEKKENEGVEVQLGGGASITVARMHNPNFSKCILAEHEKHKAVLDALPEDEKKKLDEEIMCRVLAESILVGFKGLGYKGKATPYSKDNAIKHLMVKDFRVKVVEEASKLDNYRAVMEDADAKK
jgi:hypothetical protein